MSNGLDAMYSAISLVEGKAVTLEALSSQYSALLQSNLNSLQGIRMGSVSAPASLKPPTLPVNPGIAIGSPGLYGGADVAIPGLPSIDLSGLLNGLDGGDFGVLPSTPEMPLLGIPAAPALSLPVAPARPSVDMAIVLPSAPDTTMPSLDALEAIHLPVFSFPEIPSFDGVPPDPSAITVPSPFINWAEPAYASEILPDLLAKVKEMMGGGTGLPVAVEDALFSRARERDGAETARAVQEAVDTWAGRGFSMPPGMLAKQANVAREQGRLKAAETNRDVMVEAAKWQIESIRFAVQQGIALEQLTANLHDNMAKRMFEVAKFMAESQINVFNAQISLFNAANSSFATLAQVYRTKLDGALAKLTAYKTAVEGQQAVGQINQQRVEIYKTRVEAVRSNVEVFKALMQGAQAKADTIRAQFDAYRADVQAYAEQVGAEKVKFEVFDSQVKAETSKAGMFEAQARGYAATVGAIASKADIGIKNAQLKIEVARAKIQEFAANSEMTKLGVQAQISGIQASSAAYSARVDGWRAESQAKTAAAEMQSRYADMAARTHIAFSQAQIAQYQANIQKATSEAQIVMEGAKASGQYTAQLAAGAMSALHVSASVSGSGSQSGSVSQSTSDSTSTSHNYSY